MGSKTLFLATIVLAAILGVTSPGCYTIVAVESSGTVAETIPPPPVFVFVPAPVDVPPPPPPAFVGVYVPPQHSTAPAPSPTVHRTSGPQRDDGRTQNPPTESDQRPVRTGRGR